jgi:hypothetical protein
MKKNLLRIALASFLFAGLSFIGAGNQLQAQITTPAGSLFDPAPGQFVSSPVALLRLDQAIVPLKNTMESYSQGGPLYDEAYRKYSYYNAVSNLIIEGKTVSEAIGEGLRKISTDEFNINQKLLGTYRQEIINLLKL